MPVAAPVDWDELERIERADAFSIADVELLLKRAGSMAAWGAGAQTLPRFR
jgi:bifunctional non-homologous end joining protein LigD